MKKLVILIAIISMYGGTLRSQSSISINGSPPDNSAGLDVQFTNKGFLPPRLTTVQRNAIALPATGLTIYNTTSKCLEFYIGRNS